MADNVIDQSTPETQAVNQPDHAADLKAQMDIALNGGIAPQAAEPAAGASADAGAATATVVAEPSVNDPFGLFKEKFGYETPEAAIKDIEELRAFKTAPRLPELEFANEESANLLKALAAGKREELYKYLDNELRIERFVNAEVTKDTAADIVKMGMQLKYKDLTSDEINYKFNKQYGMPPEPKQAGEELDEDYQQRLQTWQEQVKDKQMDLMIEAKLAKPELQNYKGKLVLPEIETPVDEGYIQYKKSLEDNARQDTETKEAYKALTPKAIETKINFKDEANKIAFEFQYEPDGEVFKKAVEIAANADLFWQTYLNSDETPNRTLFLESIIYALDKKSILLSAMNQSKNATIKAQLPDNSQTGLVRQIPQSQEPNELDQNMRNSLKGYGGY